MASLQAYQSHGRRYYRIVESFRENGRPRIRVIAHLGRVEDILRVHQQERTAITVSSLSAGAVTAAPLEPAKPASPERCVTVR